MTEKELLYYIALQKTKGIGSVTARKLIVKAGSAEALFQMPDTELARISGINTQILRSLKDKTVLEEARRETDFVLYHGIRYTGFADSDYPARLLHCHDAPILLFSKGNIVWDERPVISVVGTRKMTLYGKAFLEEFMEGIAPYRPVIVSGFAYGVDITAHRQAIKHKLQTVAVMAHGIQKTYPAVHEIFVDQVMQNGGFYTEYHHDALPLRENFLKRNRIVAGMSDAVIVVESGVRGGALITAEMAQSYGREVFAVPGRYKDTWSRGCNRLIRNNKAAILTSAEDLVYYLNWSKEPKKTRKPVQISLFEEPEGEEKILYDYLSHHGKSLLDDISIHTGIPVFRLSGMLLNLELKGLVKPLPGKAFQIAD